MSTAVVMMDTFLILFPLFLLLVGWLLKRHHSKYPNTFCGYHVGKIAAKSVPTLLSIVLTERHLKRKFDLHGFPMENE